MLFATKIDDGPFEALDDHLLDIHGERSLENKAQLSWFNSISAASQDTRRPLSPVVGQSSNGERRSRGIERDQRVLG